jgi:NADH-quinone oxidoreductase subunit E
MDATATRDLQPVIDRYRGGEISLIGAMQEVSRLYGYLPEEALGDLARRTGVPISLLYSLATFYNSFRLKPIGRKHVCVCVGTACHVRGAAPVVEALERELALKAGETSQDLEFTLETVNCLGACALGPLVTVNGTYHGKQTQQSALKIIRELKRGEPGST